jgi:hypothetical protein
VIAVAELLEIDGAALVEYRIATVSLAAIVAGPESLFILNQDGVVAEFPRNATDVPDAAPNSI